MTFLLATVCILAACAGAGAEEPESQTEAINDVPEDAPAGERPYEMAGRLEDRTPLFGFEDLSGWSVSTFGGANAVLARSREQQLWGRYVGKLTYTGRSVASRIIIQPPNPITIPGRFDSIDFWIYGNNWAWAPDPKTPQVHIWLILADSANKSHKIRIATVGWKEWWLAHNRLGENELSAINFPCRLAGIEITGASNTEENTIYLDSVYFYTEELKPLSFKPRPKRNLTLPEGQSPGLNTGGGKLPFPTREETILPTNFEKNFRNRVELRDSGEVLLFYEGKDTDILYSYNPSSGGFGEVTAMIDDVPVCRPLADWGVRFADGEKKPTFKAARLEGEKAAICMFDCDGELVEVKTQIMQKSLVIDVKCTGGRAVELAFGKVEGAENPRLITVPYITYGGASIPRVLLSGTAERPVFTSVWLDWYRSNGSEPYADTALEGTTARINGGVRYNPKTDGKRNDMFERFFVTVSPIYEETLPTIANPPSMRGKEAGERLWQESWGPEDYQKQMERSRMLHSYGIEKLTQCNHEITWRDGGESFTIRTESAPKKGGDDALRRYIAHQKSLGWLSGLYTNYCDFAPVNKYWNPDYVQRLPDGEWRPAWPRCYALKPAKAIEFDEELAPIIKRKFGTNAAYTDVHTAASPWGYCDYDARVPGAGTFAQTFYCYGEILLNDQKVYGPTWSEGTFQWLYAGLASGNYALQYGPVDLSKEPLNVAFDLMKIHPLECDIGMPWTSGFFKEPGWDRPENLEESIDHFIAATIAYGHIGWLVEETYGIERTCRSYYMLQALQSLYAMQRPTKIEYADGKGDYLTVSQALAAGAINDSRLHMIYENGLEVWVNGTSDVWGVRTSGGTYELPPWGWCAEHRKSDFIEYSALVGGHRMDFVSSRDHEYIDGRGVEQSGCFLRATGAAMRRKLPDGRIEIIDIYGNQYIGLIADPGLWRCSAYDGSGVSLGHAELRRSGSLIWIRCMEGARRYILESRRYPKEPKPSLSFELAKKRFSPGEDISGHFGVTQRGAKILGIVLAGPGGWRLDISDKTARTTANGRASRIPFRLRLPRDLRVNQKAWLEARVRYRVPGGTRELSEWCDLNIVPFFDIAILQSPVSFPGATTNVRIRVTSAVAEKASSRLRISCSEGYCCDAKGVEGVEFGGSLAFDVSIRAREDAEQPPGELRIRAASGDNIAEQCYELLTERVVPVWKELHKSADLSWGQAFRGGKEKLGDTRTGAVVTVEDLTCGGVTKRGIFSHPPYIGGVGYTYIDFPEMELPAEPLELHLFAGLRDGGVPSDGVTFAVKIRCEDSEKEVLKEHWANRAWKELSADLSEYAGKRIGLRFIADVGPSDDSTADWASWGEPVIRSKSSIVRVRLGKRKE